MIKPFDILSKCILGCGLALALVGPVQSAPVGSAIHLFAGPPSDGAYPWATLTKDSAGNLYGTTYYGGNATNSNCIQSGLPNGCGAVFKVAPNGTETMLYSFQGGSDGSNPRGKLIKDTAGNLYGTTVHGGQDAQHFYGTVFKLAPDGTKTVLYTFQGGSDGSWPFAGLTRDPAGNLYGTTPGGGSNGYGTVFKLAPDGTERVLHAFTNDSDGGSPTAGLIRRAGNLYGMTTTGGKTGQGAIFKLAPDGKVTVISNFCQQAGCNDGTGPNGDLAMDSAGNFYATPGSGGVNCGDYGCGTVVKFAPDGTETVLHNFLAGNDGKGPNGVIVDKAGNLFGTTTIGGGTGCEGGAGCGTVFKITPNGKERILYSFQGGSAGFWPTAGLLMDKGSLYGTASYGGSNDTACTINYGGCGVVFKVAPNNAETALQSVEAKSGND